MRMINLSFDELRLIAQVRNISDYEIKSKEELTTVLSEPKLKSPKPETSKSETPKLKTLKIKPKIISSKLKIAKSKIPKIPKLKPRPKIRVSKKKLKKLRKDFDELRHKFDKKEIGIEKLFMMLKTMKIFLYQK